MSRDMRLAHTLVRLAALNLPEPTFLGWQHFVNELNQFVNEHVRKKPGDPVTYVTLEGEPTKDKAVLNIFLEDNEGEGWDPQKMLQAVKYFTGEMGIKVGREHVAPHDSSVVSLPVAGIQTYEAPESHGRLKNKWMKKALESRRVIDVRMVGVEVEPEVFRLNEFIGGVQYVDAEDEVFIWSIGRDLESGEILAAVDTRFYMNDDYECLYLK